MIRIVFLVMLFIGAFNFSKAQEYKGSATKAATHLANGRLEKAKGEIDAAMKIQKIAGKSRAWSTKGNVYRAVAKTEEAPGSLETVSIAGEAFIKVLEMEKKGSYLHNAVTDTLKNFHYEFLNGGYVAYDEADYDMAYLNFENANAIKPKDSLTLNLVGSVALRLEKYDRALEIYSILIETGNELKETYQNLIYIQRVEKKDNAAAMEIVQKAKKKFPEETVFIKEEISILVEENRLDEARVGMEEQLKSDPNNASYLVSLGIIYDNQSIAAAEKGDNAEADRLTKMSVEKYKACVNLDPENYAANKNLASYYVNRANTVYKKATGKMDYNTYLKVGPKYEKERDATYREGLPYLEKASSLRPDDVRILDELKQMYLIIKDNDAALKIQDKIDTMLK